MIGWIVANFSTIIVCAVLIAVLAAVISSMLRDKKKGKSSCGCGCANCAMSDTCHHEK